MGYCRRSYAVFGLTQKSAIFVPATRNILCVRGVFESNPIVTHK
jgi:hypothetical protein